MPSRAVENQSYVIGLNRWGTDGNDIYHDGKSMVINPDTEVMWKGKDQEEVITITLSATDLALKRRQFPFLKDADRFSIQHD